MKKLRNAIALVYLGLLIGCGGGGNSNSGSKGIQPVVLQSIQVTPGTSSIASGLTQAFTATGKYSDNSSKDLTNSASWSSSNSTTATVSNSGVTTGKTPGSSTITATSSGVSGSATLTVTSATLVSLVVSPANELVALGATVQFTAIGTFTDGSTQNLTSTVQWTSANQSVAGMNANSTPGLAIGAALGTSSISATSGTISGSTTLTVTNPVITALTVTPAAASIAVGTTTQFAAIGTFTDGSTQNVTATAQWTSSNPAVAGINVNGASGLAKGVAAGNTTITASLSGVSSSAVLTVTSANVTSIAVTPITAALPLGTLQQFTATGSFSDGTTQDITGTVTWTSSNNSVASITSSGLATARNLGSVTITAASASIQGTASLSVNAADLASLVIVQGNTTIAASTSQQFSAIGTFNDGSTRDLTTQASWSSSNSGVAKIGSSSGVAKGLSPGAATITATLGTASNSVTLTVSNAQVVSISVTPTGRTIAPGSKLSFTAAGTFSDASTQNITRDVSWASDNTAVATVGNVSIVTGVASGTANINAILGAVTGTASLNVSSATLVSITVNPATAALAPASTLGYTALGTFSDGSTQSLTNAVTWTSSATNVATISSAGLVTAQAAGAATIAAQQGPVTGSANLVVDSSSLTSMQVTPPAASVAEKTATSFRAIGTFADGSTQDLTTSVSWTSAPASVATVSDTSGSKGLATGLAPGNATVTAVFAGQVGTASLTVTNATLTSITVTPSASSIALGSSQQFTATGNFSDGSTQNLTTQVAWTSSNVNVAAIATNGIASTAVTGTATIIATMNGVSGSTTLTVF